MNTYELDVLLGNETIVWNCPVHRTHAMCFS